MPVARPDMPRPSDPIQRATWSTSQATPNTSVVAPANHAAPLPPAIEPPPPMPMVQPADYVAPPSPLIEAPPRIQPVTAPRTSAPPAGVTNALYSSPALPSAEKAAPAPGSVVQFAPRPVTAAAALAQKPAPREKIAVARRQPPTIPAKSDIRSGVTSYRPPSANQPRVAPRPQAPPEQPYMTRGIIVIGDAGVAASPLPTAGLAAALKQRVQAVCGDAARVHKVTFVSASKIVIEVEFRNPASSAALARQIVSLPELQVYHPVIHAYQPPRR
jgi:hypothetical protein